jgi:excisionase family DNA binding protein
MMSVIDQNVYTEEQRSLDRASRDQLLTVAEIAERLKLPISWIYERTRLRGIARLPHYKLGKYLRFSEAEVWNWLKRNRVI